mgnify:CR=1 FL=1
MSREKFYITTAIAYPNGKPHIGHAYELIATDAMARFQRLDGKDVHFLTGSDEHGIKMLQSARKEGITPRELADRHPAAERAVHAEGVDDPARAGATGGGDQLGAGRGARRCARVAPTGDLGPQ